MSQLISALCDSSPACNGMLWTTQWERDRERETDKNTYICIYINIYIYTVYMCVWVIYRDRQTDKQIDRERVRERETWTEVSFRWAEKGTLKATMLLYTAARDLNRVGTAADYQISPLWRPSLDAHVGYSVSGVTRLEEEPCYDDQ